MQTLVEAIRTQGQALPGGFLKVDGLLNHQLLPALTREIGETFAAHFAPLRPNKVITVEVSGIAPALACALALDVPLLYARKKRPLTMSADVYQGQTVSRTKGGAVELFISAQYLGSADRVVVIDDFLASGHTLLTLAGMIKQSGAQLLGLGCVIEKGWEGGRAALSGLNVPIHTLANIVSLEPEFRVEAGH